MTFAEELYGIEEGSQVIETEGSKTGTVVWAVGLVPPGPVQVKVYV